MKKTPSISSLPTKELIDARLIRYGAAHAGKLCGTFNTVSLADTQSLGRRFGAVVREMQKLSHDEQRLFRLGVASNNRVKIGKTAFCQGLLEDLQQNTTASRLQSTFLPRPQHLIKLGKTGYVRYYDTGCGMIQSALPSYIYNDLSPCQSYPVIDVVEHPHGDTHSRYFDVIVNLEKQGENTRLVQIFATSQILNSQGFQRFYESAASSNASFQCLVSLPQTSALRGVDSI